MTRHSTRWLLALLPLVPGLASAEPTLELGIAGRDEVLPGDPESASVDARGVITMGPVAAELGQGIDRPIIALVLGDGGTLYAATAGAGIVAIDPNGKTRRWMESEKLVVSALAFAKGKLYAATSPDGRIVSIDGAGKESPFFDPAGTYIWALVPGDGDTMYVATGKPGRVLSVKTGGGSEVLFDPGETHIRALVRHGKLGLIAGGGQKGIVYRLDGKKAQALYDSGLEETTALAVDAKTGDIYAAFVSESKPGSLEPDTWIGPVKGDAPPDDASPIKGSEVVRIRANGSVDVLYTSKTEGALGLAIDERTSRLSIATATGKKGRGRIYAVDAADRDRLLLSARIDAPMATAILPSKGALIVGTAPAGKVLRVGPGTRQRSVWVSSEQDLRRISTIGRIWFDADVPEGARVEIAIRSGNTAMQDDTWSPWSAVVSSKDGAAVEVPRARYVQIRAELIASSKGEAPEVKSLHASVVRMNEPPHVSEVYLLRRGVFLAAMPSEEEKEKTVTISASVMKDLRKRHEEEEERLRVRQGTRPGMMTVAWTASDQNRDELLYRVELRSLDRSGAFTVVADDLEHAFHSFDSRTLPDGRYQFRVTATDRPSNPPEEAQIDQNLSEAFVIDNGPPAIGKLSAVSRDAGRIRIEAEAKDDVSALGVAEFSVAGGPWLMLPAEDGLIDSRSERLVADVAAAGKAFAPKVEKGRQTVLVRVEDEAGNASTASAILEVR
jgi:hypothetical protein